MDLPPSRSLRSCEQQSDLPSNISLPCNIVFGFFFPVSNLWLFIYLYISRYSCVYLYINLFFFGILLQVCCFKFALEKKKLKKMDWIWCVCVWERQWVKRSLINNTPEWGPLHTRPQVHTEALTWHSVCSVALQSCSILFYSLLSTVTHTLTHSHTQILQTVSTVFCPHGKRPHVRWVKSTSVCVFHALIAFYSH